MPGYRRGFSRRRGAMSLRPVNSIKNSVTGTASSGTTTQTIVVAKAVTSPSPTVSIECSHGSTIKAIWLSLDVCGLAATGVLQITDFYLMKNPGANLTPPAPVSVGTSNEKKFVIKQWRAQTMRNQDGNPPYHWEGWIKLPRIYHRMGTDDRWDFVFATSTAAGHVSIQAIYKWFS